MVEISTKTEVITFDASGIAKCIVFKDVFMSEDEAKENIEAIKKITNGKRVPVMVDIRPAKGSTKQARAYLASEEVGQVQSACALIIGSSLSQLIGNFFLGLNKTKFPVKLFNDEEKAVEWLKTFL